MVLENLIKDLINKYLGIYFEKLDGSQFKFSFIKGDVTIENLSVKSGILKEFNQPFKIPYGHLRKLNIKIPYTDLFNEPFIVQLEGLHVLIVPSESDLYNHEEEMRIELTKKLKNVEEIIQLKMTKADTATSSNSTFLQRLTIQIFKNLKVALKDVHIRYEDDTSLKNMPFSVGINISDFFLKTDETSSSDFKPHEFAKAIQLTSLSLYLNHHDELIYRWPKPEICQFLDKENKIKRCFLFKPINFVSHVYVNTKIDADGFKKPEIEFNVKFTDIQLILTKKQYHLIIFYLEAQDRLKTYRQFYKYKPVELWSKRTPRLLWNFALTSVLDYCVREPIKTWKWNYIKEFRDTRRKYIDAWKRELEEKAKADDKKLIEEYEQKLDAFNIVMCREEAQLKISKIKIKKEKSKGGWFSSWWGRKDEIVQSAESKVIDLVNTELSSEDKQTLFNVIGVEKKDANGLPVILKPSYPRNYVSASIYIDFELLEISFLDESLKNPIILDIDTNNFIFKLSYKPAIQAYKFNFNLASYQVKGWTEDDALTRPKLISTIKQEKENNLDDFIELEYVQYPEELPNIDSKLTLEVNPLEFIYDAESVNQIVKFIMIPNELKLDSLASIVQEQLSEAKEMTLSGLKHFASKRNYSKVSINVKSGFIIIPQNGKFTDNCRMLMIDLGFLTISSVDQSMPLTADVEKELSTYRNSAFDFYKVKVSSTQILLLDEGIDFRQIDFSKCSHMYLLRPLGFDIEMKKCLLKRSNYSNFSVSCYVPGLSLNITDQILLNLTELVISVPFPEFDKLQDDSSYQDVIESVSFTTFKQANKERIFDKYNLTKNLLEHYPEQNDDNDDVYDNESGEEEVYKTPDASQEIEEPLFDERLPQTLFEFDFLLKNMELRICEYNSKQNAYEPIFILTMTAISTKVKKHPCDLSILASMSSLCLESLKFIDHVEETSIGRIEIPVRLFRQIDSVDQNLLKINLLIADKNSPNFIKDYKNVRHCLDVKMNGVDVCFHLESYDLSKRFATSLLNKMTECQRNKTVSSPNTDMKINEDLNVKFKSWVDSRISNGKKESTAVVTATDAVSNILDKKDQRKHLRLATYINSARQGFKVRIPDLIIEQWNINANLGELSVRLKSSSKDICQIKIQDFNLTLAKTYLLTRVYVSLRDLLIEDYEVNREFSQVVCLRDKSELFHASITLFDPRAKSTFITLTEDYQANIESLPSLMSSSSKVDFSEVKRRIDNRESIIYTKCPTILEEFYRNLLEILANSHKTNIMIDFEVGMLKIVFHSLFWSRFLNFLMDFASKDRQNDEENSIRKKGKRLFTLTHRIIRGIHESPASQTFFSMIRDAFNYLSRENETVPVERNLSLNFYVNEPWILLPSLVENEEAFRLKLSDITTSLIIFNDFVMMETGQFLDHLIIDSRLGQITLERIKNYQSTQAEELDRVTEPFDLTLSLKMKNYLDNETKEKRTTMNLSTSLDEIKIIVSKDSYILLFGVIFNNLTKFDLSSGSQSFKTATVEPIECKISKKYDATIPDLTIDVSVKHSLIRILSHLDENLSYFELSNCNFRFDSFSMRKVISVTLEDLQIFDDRNQVEISEKTILRRLHSRRTPKDDDKIFRFNVENAPSGTKTTIDLDSLQICTPIDYTLKMMDFLAELPKISDDDSKDVEKKSQTTLEENSISEITIKLANSQLFIFPSNYQDQLCTHDSTILARVSMELFMQSKGSSKLFTMNLPDYSISLCPFTFLNNDSIHVTQILDPTKMTVNLTAEPDGDININILFPKLSITLCPFVIKNLLRITKYSTSLLNNRQRTSNKQSSESTEHFELPDDFWNMKPIEGDMKDMLRNLEVGQNQEDNDRSFLNTMKMFTTRQKFMSVRLAMDQIEMRLEETSRLNRPCKAIFSFESSIVTDLVMNQRKTLISTRILISANYLNAKLNQWQPFWEKIEVESQNGRVAEASSILLEYSKYHDDSEEDGKISNQVDDQIHKNESNNDSSLVIESKTLMILKMDEKVEITMTPETIKSILTIINEINTDQEDSERFDSISTRVILGEMIFVNRSGLDLLIAINLTQFKPTIVLDLSTKKSISGNPTKDDNLIYGQIKLSPNQYLSLTPTGLKHNSDKDISNYPCAWLAIDQSKGVLDSALSQTNLQTSGSIEFQNLIEANHHQSNIKKYNRDSLSGRIISLKDIGARVFAVPRVHGNNLEESGSVALIVDASTVNKSKIIDIRSNVKVLNHSDDTISIHTKVGKKFHELFQLTKGASHPLPWSAIASGELFIRTEATGFKHSQEPYPILNGQDGTVGKNVKVLNCHQPKDDLTYHYSLSCLQLEEDVNINTNPLNVIMKRNRDGSLTKGKINSYQICIKSALYIVNYLPFNISLLVHEREIEIAPNNTETIRQLHGISSKFKFTFQYLSEDFTCHVEVEEKSCKNFMIKCSNADKTITFSVGISVDDSDGSQLCSIFAPYWIINKTNKVVTYNVGDDATIEHDPNISPIVIHCLPTKSVFGSYKMSLKLFNSKFSDKFSIDTVGSSGRVICRGTENSVYIFGVHINLVGNGLTKVVTVAPYFALVNNTKMELLCQEIDDIKSKDSCSQEWIKVSQDSAVDFWPATKNFDGKNVKLYMRCRLEQGYETEVFPFHGSHSTVIRCLKQTFALIVNVQTTDSATVISIQDKNIENSIPVIINTLENVDVIIYQKENTSKHLLHSNMYLRYYWEDIMSEKTLGFLATTSTGQSKSETIQVQQDSFGHFLLDGQEYYWVSFWFRTRRYILFTSSITIAKNAAYNADIGPGETDMLFVVNSLGLSLVLNRKREELAYISVLGSGSRWNKIYPSQRQKPLPKKMSDAIEQKYLRYLLLEVADVGPDILKKIQPNNNDDIEVDFNEGMLLKPEKCQIVQVMEPGISLHLKVSKHQYQVHFKMFKVQIDDQRESCIFPVVLTPQQISKSLAVTQPTKPLLEVSSIVNQMPSGAFRFKYLGVLLQEIDLKCNLQFIFEVMKFLQIEDYSKSGSNHYEDLLNVNLDTVPTIKMALDHSQKSIFDMIHISPIKATITLSLSEQSIEDTSNYQSKIAAHFLSPLGGALDINDVQIKLGYFEKKNSVLSINQLTSQVSTHYLSQFLRQIYCFVLNLDVLGGPYGIFVGFGEGVRDVFYEPALGAIQGPEEFAEGLALGFKSLFKGTFGSAAGAISKVTGVMGRGVAMLSLDKDFQNNRLQSINKKPENFQTGLARGGIELYKSLYDGFTGIVTQPKQGLEKDGAKGFLKGMGKGFLGLVVRPVGGIIDMASTSMEGLKSLADESKEVVRVRHPRYIELSSYFEIFNLRMAKGYHILQKTDRELAKGFINYIASSKENMYLFLTLKFILEVECNENLNMSTINKQINIANADSKYTFDINMEKFYLSIDYEQEKNKADSTAEGNNFLKIFKSKTTGVNYTFPCDKSESEFIVELIKFQIEKNKLLNVNYSV